MVYAYKFVVLIMCPQPAGPAELKFLHRELHPISHKWFSLGVQLQIPFDTLKCIEIENRQMDRCLLEMLTIWLQRTNPLPTFNILIEALESPPVGAELLAQKLRDKDITSDSTSPDPLSMPQPATVTTSLLSTAQTGIP